MTKNNLSLSIILAALIIGGALIFTLSGGGGMSGKTLSRDEAVQKALAYINQNLRQEGKTASLVESSKANGLYKFKVKIGDQEFESYVTLDGKLLFPQAIVLEEKESAEKKTGSKTGEVPKTDRPDVKLFVMSYCPFGLQTEKAFLPVYNLLKDKADMGIYFVDYAMHGKKEIDENLRQYCLQKEQKEKYADYLSCFTEKADYQACLNSSGVDQQKLSSCMKTADEKFGVTKSYEDKDSWRGGRFPEFLVHSDLNKKYGVQGSPTLVINDKVVSAERSPEGIKKVICEAFKSPPEECSQTLSEKTASPGFGRGSGNSGSGGSCQ